LIHDRTLVNQPILFAMGLLSLLPSIRVFGDSAPSSPKELEALDELDDMDGGF
jgi:hypothetical protein